MDADLQNAKMEALARSTRAVAAYLQHPDPLGEVQQYRRRVQMRKHLVFMKTRCEMFEKEVECRCEDRLAKCHNKQSKFFKVSNSVGPVTTILFSIGSGIALAMALPTFGITSFVAAAIAAGGLVVTKIDENKHKRLDSISEELTKVGPETLILSMFKEVGQELSRIFEDQLFHLKHDQDVEMMACCAVNLMFKLKEGEKFSRNNMLKKVVSGETSRKNLKTKINNITWRIPHVFQKTGLRIEVATSSPEEPKKIQVQFKYLKKPSDTCDPEFYGYRGQILELVCANSETVDSELEEKDGCGEELHHNNNECKLCSSDKDSTVTYFKESEIDRQYTEICFESSQYQPFHCLVQCPVILESVSRQEDSPGLTLKNHVSEMYFSDQNKPVKPVYRSHSPRTVRSLCNADLSGSNFNHVHFANCTLEKCVFTDCTILFGQLKEVNLRGSCFQNSRLSYCNLVSANAQSCQWTTTKVLYCCLDNADLRGGVTTIGGNDWTGSNLEKALIGNLPGENGHTDVVKVLEDKMSTNQELSGNRAKELSQLQNKPTIEKTMLDASVSKTLSRDEKKNNRISLLFIGQDGAGKTSLKKTLLGEAIDENEPSTIGIEFHVVEVKEDNKSLPWKQAEDSQFMASENYAESVVGKQVARDIVESRKLRERLAGRRDEVGSAIDVDRRRPADEPGDKSERTDEGLGEPDNKGEDKSGDGIEVVNSVGGNEARSKDDNRSKTLIGNRSGHGSKGKSSNWTRQKNPVDSYKTDGFRRKVEKEMKNVEDYRDDTMDTIRFLFGDVAGQSVYYDVHSIMLRSKALFILVVDLSKTLHEEARPKFVQKGTKLEQTIGNPLKETNLDYVTRWGAAIRNLSPCNEETKKNPLQSSQVAKIILVFTKPDKLSSEEADMKRKEAANILEERFIRIGCETIGKFVIQNTGPRNADEVKRLREKIFETAQNLLKEQEKTPIRWLMLERALDVRRKEEGLKHCPYIELDEARKLDREYSKVNEKFEEAMRFLHQESIVVHFSENVTLKNIVVLDANWLVQLFTKVLTVPEDVSCGTAESSAWKALTEKGELQFDNLPNPLDDLSQKEALKLMMVNTGLICHHKDNTYLVPSMITKRMGESDIRDLLSSCAEKSLYIDFKDETLPLAFYTRFQVELLMLVGPKIAHQTELYHNFMRLTMTENEEPYAVIFVRHASRIEVAIKVDEEIKNYRKHCEKIAKSVLNSLYHVVQKIQRTHPCCRGMRYEFGLKCDLCCPNKCPEKCLRHGQEHCDDGNCVCIMSLEDLKEGKKQDLSCPKNNLGKVKSKLHEAAWFKAFDDPIEHRGTAEETDQPCNRTQKHPHVDNEPAMETMRIMETRNSYGDPPAISVAITELKDINPEPKSWESVQQLTDVVLLVVDDEELESCYAFLHDVFRSYSNDLGKVYFGEIGVGPKNVKVSLVRSGQGSTNVVGSQNVARNAAEVLNPKVVFSVGCCPGLQREKINLGDVVISQTILNCGDKKFICDKHEWGFSRLNVPTNAGRLIKSAGDGWKAPLSQPGVCDVKVHCNAEILTGVQIENSPQQCKVLLDQYPNAVAIGHQGQGVYSAAFDRQIEWVIVKGISHYADGAEPGTKKWRRFSSVMAASVVNHILKEPDVLERWRRCQDAIQAGNRTQKHPHVDNEPAMETTTSWQYPHWSTIMWFLVLMIAIAFFQWFSSNS